MCRDMHSFSAQYSRVDLSELKLQIVSKIGEKKTAQYLGHLNSFLGQNLSKFEFNRLCLLILGRENVKLHNRLIRSILSNVYRAKIPPPPPLHAQDSAKPFEETGRDRTVKLPNGRKMVAHSILRSLPEIATSRENGTLKRPAQEQHNEDVLPENAAKRPRQDKPLLDQGNAVGNRQNSLVPLKAPLGIPLCKASIGGACILPTIASRYNVDDVSCQDDTLMKRMEDIAELQGLKGVTMECTTLLNSGLDAYLKRLIKLCIDLRRPPPNSRQLVLQQEQQYQQQQVQQQTYGKLSNGLQPTIEKHYSVSMLDFNVAIELNSWRLVEDCPILQEKIQCHFQE